MEEDRCLGLLFETVEEEVGVHQLFLCRHDECLCCSKVVAPLIVRDEGIKEQEQRIWQPSDMVAIHILSVSLLQVLVAEDTKFTESGAKTIERIVHIIIHDIIN